VPSSSALCPRAKSDKLNTKHRKRRRSGTEARDNGERREARRKERTTHRATTGKNSCRQSARIVDAGQITDKRLRRGSFENVPALIKAITDYLDNHNQNPKVFVWSAPVERIKAKIAKCKEALDALH
jgi:hypothetical protein